MQTVLTVILPIFVGFLLSIYAGFISARIIGFQDLRNRSAVLVSQIGYAYTKKENLLLCLSRAEEIRLSGLAIVEAGHRRAGRAIEAIGIELIAVLNEKLKWREGVQERDINSIIFTPVFSEEKIAAMEVAIRGARFDRRIILSVDFSK